MYTNALYYICHYMQGVIYVIMPMLYWDVLELFIF